MTVNERATVDHFRLGLMLAVGSAFAFGSSGPFAKALMEAGWSPTAAVVARLAGGALVMAVFATIVRPGWVGEALRHTRTVVLYGAIPIAGAQLFYYNAVAHLSVGVALLLEYTAPILVVGWVWTTTRRRPSNLHTRRRRLGGSRNHVRSRGSRSVTLPVPRARARALRNALANSRACSRRSKRSTSIGPSWRAFGSLRNRRTQRSSVSAIATASPGATTSPARQCRTRFASAPSGASARQGRPRCMISKIFAG